MKYLTNTGITRFWNNIKSYVTSKIPTKVSELDNDLEFLTSVPDHDASKITSGTIDIARLPQGALERLAIVADESARFALTSSNVQVGDVVKQSDTDIMYMVVDESNLNNSAGYVEFTAGTATSVPWSGVSNKPETFTPSSHTHTVSEVTDFPSNLVTTNTNQNISGQKTFTSNSFYTSNVYHRSDSYDVGTTPASNVTVQHFFADKANKYTGLVRSVVYTSGRTGTELCSRNLIKNGALDATGSEVITRFNVEVQPNGDKTMYFDSSIRNDVLPFENNTYNLGSALNQWNNTYTNKLYLNGVEFGLGTANTWTGTNTFPSVTIKDTTALSNGDYGGVLAYRDNQGNRHGYIQTYKDTSGTVNLVVGSDNGNVQLNSNTIPYTNNTISLGSSTNQWNNTYTNKLYLNGTEFGVNKINTWAVAQNYKASLRFIHDSYETGTPLSDVFWESLTWGGMVNNSFERIVGINTAKRTNGFNDLSVRVYSQTGATLTGTVWETNADASSVSFRPILTDTNNLGTSLFQWNNTYTNKLYLNGTEFGLGTANVWTAQNTFSYGDAPIKIVNSKDATSPSATEMKDIRFFDVNNKIIGGVRHSLETDGTSKMNLYARSWTSDGEYNSSHGLVITNNRQTNVHEVKSESNFVPSGTNTHNLGSSTNQWLHLHVLNTHTDLVEPTMSNTGLVVRATDNTWENGSRIFLYSNTAPNQTYGTIYIDVDHGDGNNTKTALFLTPNEFVPGGGGTTGVSLGSSTHQWTTTYTSKLINKRTNTDLANYCDLYQCVNDSNSRVVSFRATHSANTKTLLIGVHDSNNSAPKGVVISNDGSNNISLYPSGASDTMGTAGAQWDKVYSKTYYYNGTQWGLDQANTWASYQTISGTYLGNENSTNARTCLYLASNRDTVGQSGIYVTKFRQNVSQGALDSSHYHFLGFDILENSVRTNNGFTIRYTGWTDDVPTKVIIDSSIEDCSLGSTTRMWNSIYANSFNGINPGALSLPSLASASITVDTTLWDLTGATDISYTPTVDGWLQLRCKDTDGDFFFAYWGNYRQSVSGRGYLSALVAGMAMTIPVRKNVEVTLRCKVTNTIIAYFTPCLGNV